MKFRDAVPADAEQITQLYRAAFPEEDLTQLIRELFALGDQVLSLVAVEEDDVVGHVMFTFAGLPGSSTELALLSPLAVSPDRQRSGIGTALVRYGLGKLREAGVIRVLTLGDPAYYGRQGFEVETAIAPPYPLPDAWREAWQGVPLQQVPAPVGTISLPVPWRRPELWRP